MVILVKTKIKGFITDGITILNMSIDDHINRLEAYKLISGREQLKGTHPWDYPHCIDPKNADMIYLVIKKMQRTEVNYLKRPEGDELMSSIKKVDQAYLSGNHSVFEEEVVRFMSALSQTINSEFNAL